MVTETKRCSKCGEVKPLADFSPRKRLADGFAYFSTSCKVCVRKYQREYRKMNPELQHHKNALKRVKIQAMLSRLKDRPCADCGGRFPPYVMDFDHRDRSTKRGNVSHLGNRRLVEEAEKCDVICSNCHRVRTYTRGEYGTPKPLSACAGYTTRVIPARPPKRLGGRQRKLEAAQVVEIRQLASAGLSKLALSRRFSVSRYIIAGVLNGVIYRWVQGEQSVPPVMQVDEARPR